MVAYSGTSSPPETADRGHLFRVGAAIDFGVRPHMPDDETLVLNNYALALHKNCATVQRMFSN